MGLKKRFYIPNKYLSVPTLDNICRILKTSMCTEIVEYYSEFKVVLAKHLQTETEIQIVDGLITSSSYSQLLELETEWNCLQYKSRLSSILQEWKLKLCGQPIASEIESLIDENIQLIINEFEKHIFNIQNYTQRKMKEVDNNLCKAVTNEEFRVLNLTTFKIPPEVSSLLSHGINFVPQTKLPLSDLKKLMEQNLIKAAIDFYRDCNRIYPLVTEGASLQSSLKQLMAQVPSNSNQLLFYITLYESYMGEKLDFYQNLSSEYQNIDNQEPLKSFDKLLPPGTILSISDKGLGPCLLPLDWYVLQYAIQSEKGSHVKTGMSSDQCINYLKKEIELFRKSLNDSERKMLKHYFCTPNPNYRVGVLKLIPKVHKISTFNDESWRKLPSRPIRGAESCPINAYSKSLCKLLQEMHQAIKEKFVELDQHYPVIYGCDEYSTNIQKITYQNCSRITLISGDFSDAYTKSSLHDLEHSLTKLSDFIDWPSCKTTLAMKLSKLVFDNCFFETPDGIMKQNQGFPMGGHSSREGLDNILLSCELIILNSSVAKH